MRNLEQSEEILPIPIPANIVRRVGRVIDSSTRESRQQIEESIQVIKSDPTISQQFFAMLESGFKKMQLQIQSMRRAENVELVPIGDDYDISVRSTLPDGFPENEEDVEFKGPNATKLVRALQHRVNTDATSLGAAELVAQEYSLPQTYTAADAISSAREQIAEFTRSLAPAPTIDKLLVSNEQLTVFFQPQTLNEEPLSNNPEEKF